MGQTSGRMRSRYTANLAPFAFEDISNTGTRVLSGTDDAVHTVPIDFTFQFYGQEYNAVSFSSNGLVTFAGGTNAYNNVPISQVSTYQDLPMIAVLWDDWQFFQNGADAVYFQTLGEEGSRRLVVQWNIVYGFSSSPSTVTFQAILFEGSNHILLQYLDVDSEDSRAFGNDATVGIRNTSGHLDGNQLQWSHNSPVIMNDMAILLDPNPPFASPGLSQTIACDGPSGTMVVLDGSGSYDPNGNELEYVWSVPDGSGVVLEDADKQVAVGIFPLGVHEVALTVYNLDAQGARRGGSSAAAVTITVYDDMPPDVTCTSDVTSLSPSNHKMMPVRILIETADHCTEPENMLVSCFISNNQADDTDGTGEHIGDVNGVNGSLEPVEIDLEYVGRGAYAAVVYLRAERDGYDKSGRIYTIDAVAVDGAGNVGHASTQVVVTHNQRKSSR
jgi:hypothetical protein